MINSRPAPRKRTPADSITPVEWAVLRRVLKGMTNKAVGSELQRSEKTVKAHMTRIMRVAGVNTRSQLIAEWHNAQFRVVWDTKEFGRVVRDGAENTDAPFSTVVVRK